MHQAKKEAVDGFSLGRRRRLGDFHSAAPCARGPLFFASPVFSVACLCCYCCLFPRNAARRVGGLERVRAERRSRDSLSRSSGVRERHVIAASRTSRPMARRYRGGGGTALRRRRRAGLGAPSRRARRARRARKPAGYEDGAAARGGSAASRLSSCLLAEHEADLGGHGSIPAQLWAGRASAKLPRPGHVEGNFSRARPRGYTYPGGTADRS